MEQLNLLHFAVLACALAFFVSFFTMLYATLLVIVRAGAGVNRAEEQALSWGERAGRANAASANSLSPINSERYAGSTSVPGWPRLDQRASASCCCLLRGGFDETIPVAAGDHRRRACCVGLTGAVRDRGALEIAGPHRGGGTAETAELASAAETAELAGDLPRCPAMLEGRQADRGSPLAVRKVIEQVVLLVVFLALVAALVWFAISHEDARAALKETCAFVQRQGVLHAEGRDVPEGLEDAAHACWKEGLLPKAVTK